MNFNLLKDKFTKADARQINPLVLAFIGDAIYEVFVRTYLVDRNRDMSVHKLHVKAIEFVKAHAQSEFIKKIEEELNEEEIYFFKRGRNSKSGTVPKNADVQEYRTATGFETLIGFLYITEQNERLNYLLELIVQLYVHGGKISGN
ncbi:Mini-ribonuclease 3 [Clostridium thailandense]|uniref:Mini-ribonuclease 3 n=1 Tax=Clostridium thailandense TaxID=2794346 RepID=A0A949WRW1_9CLOT|nr:ribonuclease III domain-containing protein [Clostridium thailandense]MBV7274490.1 Mini-ribonuclease 3 [Clostridium thailandense]